MNIEVDRVEQHQIDGKVACAIVVRGADLGGVRAWGKEARIVFLPPQLAEIAKVFAAAFSQSTLGPKP